MLFLLLLADTIWQDHWPPHEHSTADSPMRPYGTWRIGAWTASQPQECEWEREKASEREGRWRERGSATAVDTCRTTKLFRKFLGRVQELASTSLRFNTAQIDNDITIPPPRPHDRLVDLHNTSWVYSINWVRIERGGECEEEAADCQVGETTVVKMTTLCCGAGERGYTWPTFRLLDGRRIKSRSIGNRRRTPAH